MPDEVPARLRWFSAATTTARKSASCCRCSNEPAIHRAFGAWRETNVQPQKQAGYAIVTVKAPQGNLTGDQMRGLAKLAEQAGDGSLRFTMNQNVVLAWVPLAAVKRVYRALGELGLNEFGRQ